MRHAPNRRSVFAYREVRRRRRHSEVRHDLTILFLAWGLCGASWWAAVQGAPYTAYAVRLGANPLMLGLLSAAAVLGVVAQPLSSYWVERTGRRKLIFLVAGFIQRPLWVLVGALPFLIPSAHERWRLMALLGLALLSSTLGSAMTPAWISWIAYVIPQRVRARFLGTRFRLGTVTGIIVALVVGWVLDRSSSYLAFFAIFGFAALMGIGDVLFISFVPRRYEIRASEPPSLISIIFSPWRDASFRRYLFYAASSAASYGIIGQFATLYLLENLALGKFFTNLYMLVIPLVIAALLGPAFGRQIAYFGNRPVLMLTTMLAILVPVMWGLAGPTSYVLLTAASVVAGVVTAALTVAELNMLFTMTPADKRSAHVAAVAVVSGLVGAVAPVLGGAIAQWLTGWERVVWGVRLVNLHGVFLAATLLRVIHLAVFVPRLPEPKARSTAALVTDLLREPGGIAAATVQRLRRR
ncbi:MAG: MFS transporter [Armatimonadota bacterium]|nr:MAG: MFS transporter [Armatimonadota bacterium]